MKLPQTQCAKVLVCQRGARHRYSIPRLFEESGMLAGLYTDSSAFSPAGKLAGWLSQAGVRVSKVTSLSARKPVGIPREKIFSFDEFSIFPRQFVLAEKYMKAGLQEANVVYSMCGEDPPFLHWAKERDAKLIVDIFVHPGTERIVEEETVRYCGESPNDPSFVEAVESHFRRSFDLADIIQCPSSWVADGVREYAPEHRSKIRVVPYGSSLEISASINPDVTKGRILFAGRELLRKGVHYLAEAAALIREQGHEIDVRIAGMDRQDADDIAHADQLNFLGLVPMDSMRNEFQQADVFVLPSLSEGQASVILEAMACGCPVISTRESGVDLNADSGIMIPARNADALAQAIIKVIEDRDYRNRLAKGALNQAETFSVARWKQRLVEVVTELVG